MLHPIEIENKGKSCVHHSSYSKLLSFGVSGSIVYIFGRPGRFRLLAFVLRTHASCTKKLDDMLALGSRQLCLLAWVVAL